MTSSKYKVVEISADPAHFEMISAMLSMLNFESFHEDEKILFGYYLPSNFEAKEIEERLNDINDLFPLKYSFQQIEEENWNKKWEENFEAVVVDDKVRVRASFHEESAPDLIDILINPQMAFGTAHHETSYMMLSAMMKLDLENKHVLDYGCGTGILALLAEKQGASKVVAIDYDVKSVQNTLENMGLNQSEKIDVLEGDLSVLKADSVLYDCILANINRSVLLANAQALFDKIEANGHLMLSGILEVDFTLIEEAYSSLFTLINKTQRGEWLCLEFQPKK